MILHRDFHEPYDRIFKSSFSSRRPCLIASELEPSFSKAQFPTDFDYCATVSTQNALIIF